MRSDFKYLGEFSDEGIWMIWPEFIDQDGNVIQNEDVLPKSGKATMWIVSREKELLNMHLKRLKVGMVAELVTGARTLATVKVTKILGLKSET